MLSKAELDALVEKYEAKAARAYQNYQETGITRYDREHRNADDLASAMRMAASARKGLHQAGQHPGHGLHAGQQSTVRLEGIGGQA